MGGANAGEQASALAVVAIERFTLNTLKWFFDSNGPEAQRVLTQFQTALRQADARILEESTEHPELSGMGTTVTMAFQLDAQLCVVHVGDSRAYMYGDDELYQLTHDDTLVADTGQPGRASARAGGPAPPPPRHHATSSEALKPSSTSKRTR